MCLMIMIERRATVHTSTLTLQTIWSCHAVGSFDYLVKTESIQYDTTFDVIIVWNHMDFPKKCSGKYSAKVVAMLALPNMITFKIFVTALIIFLDRLSILNYIN